MRFNAVSFELLGRPEMARLPQDVMDLIEDMLDCELVPQVYVLESARKPWRPVLRDEPYEPPCLVPGVRRDAPERHETDPYGFDGDDVWDIL